VLVRSSKKSLDSLGSLNEAGWLSKQSEELRLWFAAKGRWRTFSPGQVLYLEGDKADGLYGLATGAIDLEFAPEELESFVMIRLHPGGWIGQAALLPDMKRPVNLTVPVESEVFFVPRRALRTLLAERPDFWPDFYSLAVLHLTELMEFLCDALVLSPDARLARLLLRLTVTTPDIKVSQHDLGAMLGMPRSSLRRSIKGLAEAGVVRTGYGIITVTDRLSLENLLAES
jgi:CRP/FNR family transcriptional regulator, cyclic AMP receptor protein